MLAPAKRFRDHGTMTETAQHITFSQAGKPLDVLPRCSGVYRFFDTDGALLYVAKVSTFTAGSRNTSMKVANLAGISG